MDLDFGVGVGWRRILKHEGFATKELVHWLRFGSVLVAGLALFFVFRRIDLHELALTLRWARPGWLLAAIALYGFGFLPAAWRWHLMLALDGWRGASGATARMTLMGHFFYTLFFGMRGETWPSPHFTRVGTGCL